MTNRNDFNQAAVELGFEENIWQHAGVFLGSDRHFLEI